MPGTEIGQRAKKVVSYLLNIIFDNTSYILDTFSMRFLSRAHLNPLLTRRGLNLSRLARKSGVSRQSLYQMLAGASIYNVPFQKLIRFLRISPDQITDEHSASTLSLEQSPAKIRKAALRLLDYCKKKRASLILFGSRARETHGKGSDWDFAVYFHGKVHDHELRRLKQQLQEQTFPYRIDIVNLNQAPHWFLRGVREDGLVLEGSWPETMREAA